MASIKMRAILLFVALLGLAAADASECTEVRARVPWTSLTTDEKAAYINADLCLINSPTKLRVPGAVTRWDDMQWPHVAQSASVHNVGAFLPFHRYYLTAHERVIRDECGYTGRMPYWDELADVNDLYRTDMWEDQYFGGNGTDDGTSRVVNGSFANLTLRWLADGTYSDHWLTRINNKNSLRLTNQAHINVCNAKQNYSTAWDCWGQNPHLSGHQAVGGILLDGTLSPGDPFFFLHHAWLDKLFWEWQKMDLPARLTDMGGPNIPAFGGSQPGGPAGPNGTGVPSAPGVPANPSGNLLGVGPEFTNYFGDDGGNITTLNHTLWMVDILPNVTIADVMDLNGPVVCSEYYDE
ncbi:hypothetical protein PFICI_11301 [Pestalotiopsis fici W106-1]|uniref:Tyrosinase copper-binding domain-containing protein n=1 Tax=Pestalotiopsis fici (strain W106-1 / CGMCC3.15140) TaxID=1229662 RepID=W3WWC9_PESFW|nr:uncharacterized protein PFICI_11301 [Pestalotiopsis fici W106-1]ETS77427.1 hypothetical protein PFICI_11301 [Pestalotiopsis fici W106-1]